MRFFQIIALVATGAADVSAIGFLMKNSLEEAKEERKDQIALQLLLGSTVEIPGTDVTRTSCNGSIGTFVEVIGVNPVHRGVCLNMYDEDATQTGVWIFEYDLDLGKVTMPKQGAKAKRNAEISYIFGYDGSKDYSKDILLPDSGLQAVIPQSCADRDWVSPGDVGKEALITASSSIYTPKGTHHDNDTRNLQPLQGADAKVLEKVSLVELLAHDENRRRALEQIKRLYPKATGPIYDAEDQQAAEEPRPAADADEERKAEVEKLFSAMRELSRQNRSLAETRGVETQVVAEESKNALALPSAVDSLLNRRLPRELVRSALLQEQGITGKIADAVIMIKREVERRQKEEDDLVKAARQAADAAMQDVAAKAEEQRRVRVAEEAAAKADAEAEAVRTEKKRQTAAAEAEAKKKRQAAEAEKQKKAEEAEKERIARELQRLRDELFATVKKIGGVRANLAEELGIKPKDKVLNMAMCTQFGIRVEDWGRVKARSDIDLMDENEVRSLQDKMGRAAEQLTSARTSADVRGAIKVFTRQLQDAQNGN